MDADSRLALLKARHTLELNRLGRGTLKDFLKLLREVEDDLTAQVVSRYEAMRAKGFDRGPATTARLEELLRQVVEATKVYNAAYKTVERDLIGVAQLEFEFTNKALASVGFDVGNKIPEPAKLRAIVNTTPIKSDRYTGHILKSWTDTMAAKTVSRVEGAIRVGMVEGQTTDQIAARIRGSKTVKGIMEISKGSAETLVRTATATISNAAAMESYRSTGVVTAVQWSSTFDSRTTDICQSRDGKIWRLDEPHPQPPAHPNCRSVLNPITKSFRDLGLDRDEHDEDDRTFEDYIKTASKAKQNETFGVKRAELYRSGKIDFRQLYNNDDRFYTLAELRANHPKVFE